MKNWKEWAMFIMLAVVFLYVVTTWYAEYKAKNPS
jgi:hypothetical protein